MRNKDDGLKIEEIQMRDVEERWPLTVDEIDDRIADTGQCAPALSGPHGGQEGIVGWRSDSQSPPGKDTPGATTVTLKFLLCAGGST